MYPKPKPVITIRVTRRWKSGVETFEDRLETFEARLNWLERLEKGWYFGYSPISVDKNALWGCALLYDKPQPYGVVSVEVL